MLHGLPKGIQFLTIESFESAVGEDFYIDAQPAPIAVRLDRLTKPLAAPGFLPRAPFSVLWSTDLCVSLLRGIYKFRNGGWGPHPVYVEPMQFIGERRAYQSVFF